MKRHHAILTLIVAVMAMLAAGCQKEEETVTLVAEIQKPMNGNDRLYIDESALYWRNGDKVFVNNASYPVTAASGALAQIENVAPAKTYQAIYPAGIVTGDNKSSNSSSLPVNLPTSQTYRLLADGHQRVELPMAAHLTNGNTLRFYSLCSIVRVTVSNPLARALPLASIELRARTAKLSGAGIATVVRQECGHLDMSSNATNNVLLAFTDDCPAMVEAQGSGTFDIVVPPFTTDDMTLTLYTTDGYMCEVGKEKVALAQNAIDTVMLNVTELTEAPRAKLISGPDFNAAIPKDNKTKSVVFEYNSPVMSGVLLSTPDSPVPIYGNLDGTTWRVSTRASQICANPDCSSMFMSSWTYYQTHYGRERRVHLLLKRIIFGNGFNTDSVTNMRNMFVNGQELTGLDVSSFNTENVTDMKQMFAGCWSLTSLDVSTFNTSKVTDMSYMFFSCEKLTELDVSNFNTENVTDMKQMFTGCWSLTSLDVSNFNTSKVTDMSYMFSDCFGLTSLDLSNFNTSKVTDMYNMFADCRNLTRLDVSSFNTENVTVMCGMFDGCSGLTNLNITNFNTENVTNMSDMFNECSGLTNLDLSNFNTSNVTGMETMFCSCRNMTNLNLSNFDMSNVTYKGWMCSDLSTNSGACTITCPTAVRTALENGTDLPTSGVVFTWVTP